MMLPTSVLILPSYTLALIGTASSAPQAVGLYKGFDTRLSSVTERDIKSSGTGWHRIEKCG